VTPVDLSTGAAGPSVAVGNGPIGVAVADGTVWVTNGDDGTVSRLDAATGARRGPEVDVGSGPVAVGVLGDDVWVLNQDAGTVTHLRASTGTRAEPDLAIPGSMTRARDLIVTDDGVWIAGTDRAQAAFLQQPRR
jgi:DNA-binding beta-propeller fold protein YncE